VTVTKNGLRLMLVAAHPDDETLGFGGVLARYASEGVETSLVTATRGERGRYQTHRFGTPQHPGAAALGRIREAELRDAAAALRIGHVRVLDYQDQELDRAKPAEAVALVAAEIRAIRPHVVMTFAPDGAYGHPDHIAISQLTTAAIVEAAAHASEPHRVRKLYYLAWGAHQWAMYQRAFKKLVSVVDGVERQATPWPDWAITTVVDTRTASAAVWRAVACHASQAVASAALDTLDAADRDALWDSLSFYRVFSLVNGGRQLETDLFEGCDAEQ
jgi:LmbE family N-acetylglucosaminyl deacetylase